MSDDTAPRGKRGRQHALTPSQILQARYLYWTVGWSPYRIARELGVCRWTIQRALRRQRGYANSPVVDAADKLDREWAKAPPHRRPPWAGWG